MKGRGGYYRVMRGTREHPFLREDGREFSRSEAWLWLIEHAAWQPRAAARRHGAVHLERGQIAATVREIAKAWAWPKSRVDRFLVALAGHAMIRLSVSAGTRVYAISDRKQSYSISLITVCNYEKYQGAGSIAGARSEPDNGPGVNQESPSLPMAMPVSATLTTETKQNIESESKSSRSKPFHGARGGPGRRMIWLDHGTDDWDTHAADYRSVMGGAEILPQTRPGGRGNWFYYLGQATAKKRA